VGLDPHDLHLLATKETLHDGHLSEATADATPLRHPPLRMVIQNPLGWGSHPSAAVSTHTLRLVTRTLRFSHTHISDT
jgi:hypothetical protein